MAVSDPKFFIIFKIIVKTYIFLNNYNIGVEVDGFIHSKSKAKKSDLKKRKIREIIVIFF